MFLLCFRFQKAIRDDRTHGAMQLMGWAVEAVGTWARVKLEEEEGSGQVGPYPCVEFRR